MLDHVSIGVRDIARTRRFYDAALKPLGYTCLNSGDDYLGYGAGSGSMWMIESSSPVPADKDSGVHIGFDAPSRASVDQFHAAALASGGQDNGKPGVRRDYGPHYYAAFVIDPDGYRIEPVAPRRREGRGDARGNMASLRRGARPCTCASPPATCTCPAELRNDKFGHTFAHAARTSGNHAHLRRARDLREAARARRRNHPRAGLRQG